AGDEDRHLEHIFTLGEANSLVPQLEDHLISVKRSRALLLRIKDEIKKASGKAQFGGGSSAGPHYIRALQEISEHLQAIHEMGVLVKDLDMGLCDFPAMLDGRIVFLCWKLGEPDVRWWHEVHSGYLGRQSLEHKFD
ncbi:MAG: DUF2203 domain-containing protein, partial [Nitrospirales bacterium]